MSESNTPTRTPTLVSTHSAMSKVKQAPSDSRRGSDHSSVVSGSDAEKKVKAPTTTPTGPQVGMVAPLQLSRWRFWAIFISLMISIFLFALGESLPFEESRAE